MLCNTTSNYLTQKVTWEDRIGSVGRVLLVLEIYPEMEVIMLAFAWETSFNLFKLCALQFPFRLTLLVVHYYICMLRSLCHTSHISCTLMSFIARYVSLFPTKNYCAITISYIN